MPKYGSKSVWFLVDGYNVLLGKLQGLRQKTGLVTEPTDGLGDDWRAHCPTGDRFAELVQEGGFFDTSAGSTHASLGASNLPTGPQSVARVVCLGEGGNVNGRPFTGFEGVLEDEYEVLSEIGKLQRANAAWKVSGKLEDGLIVHALAAETAPGNSDASSIDSAADPGQRVTPITSSSVAPASIITCPVPHRLTTGDSVLIAGHTGSTPTVNGDRVVTVLSPTTFSVPVNVTVGGTGGTFTRAKTVNGGTGYLQVTAITLGGYTNVIVKLRHSVDNITFVDLVTFTAKIAIGAERIALAAGTAVNRYLSSSIAFTGAGSGPSCTYLVGFSRS
jgi:hypothetical protein